MAKQKKVLPARKAPGRSRIEESLSLRSAESLGRVIGTLQRQLDHAFRRFGEHSATRMPLRSRTSDESPRSPRRNVKRLRDAAAGNGNNGATTRASNTSKEKTSRARTAANGSVAKRAARPK